ncbi:NAD(P)H-quinone oxidoreductase subunit O, chloroplastic [Dioscorea cayenensis subsp. rotundata]|uniref:NAD(P)H-quinone oxidoreductase subunit O, chloroplastic n=1 Tax=Dioscorea cayennensis subsp. rotundata TaxID=55577 RepID=A0AB40C261_DIOCR|nr:NAD(P)H-quinone oxidoreductase subunit O, chloroplastic [Dioscorea cayenensis subsp. rotundata]
MASFVHLPLHSTIRFLSFSPSRAQALNPPSRTPSIKASTSAEPEKESKLVQTAGDASPPSSQSSPPPRSPPKKTVYSMKKGQIVRVDKEKYLNSINYLSVGHPPYYKGLDYIYEDRGEILDLKIFETGEYALVAWVGIPTAPAWLPTDMLIKSDKLDYERL